jgi:uncharacterized protein YuzE
MELQLDTSSNHLYISFLGANVSKTIDIDRNVRLCLDKRNFVVGIEFTTVDVLVPFLSKHEGRLNIPEHIANPDEFELQGG